MNTLNKEITKNFFLSEENYEELETRWSKLVQANKKDPKKNPIKTTDILLYSVLRGKDWRKMFSPVTNEVKLQNGYSEYHAAQRAIQKLIDVQPHWIVTCGHKWLEGLVTAEQVKQALKYLNERALKTNSPAYIDLEERAFRDCYKDVCYSRMAVNNAKEQYVKYLSNYNGWKINHKKNVEEFCTKYPERLQEVYLESTDDL